MSQQRTTPPNIAGYWSLESIKSLRHLDINTPVTVGNVEMLTNTTVIIHQNGLFLTLEHQDEHETRPEVSARVGIWKPTLNIKGKITSWEAVFADNDDNNVAYIQVMHTRRSGHPDKLLYYSIESGFEAGNPVQVPSVSQAVMTRLQTL